MYIHVHIYVTYKYMYKIFILLSSDLNLSIMCNDHAWGNNFLNSLDVLHQMHVRNIIGQSNIYVVHPGQAVSVAVINKLQLAPAQKEYSQDLLRVSVFTFIPIKDCVGRKKLSKTRMISAQISCAVINTHIEMITRYRAKYI